MMQLTEHRPGRHHHIRRVGDAELTINEQTHRASLILGAHLLLENWPVRGLADLDEITAQPLLEHAPELVILGCGTRAGFPTPEVQQLFFDRGIGLESMNLAAACRTFNILMSENRRAVAGLILPLPSA